MPRKVRMAIIKASANNKRWRRLWRKGSPPTLLVEMFIGRVTMENSMEFLEKLKIKLLYDPEIPLLSIYLEKILIQKDTSTLTFTIYNSQDMEATQMSIKR